MEIRHGFRLQDADFQEKHMRLATTPFHESQSRRWPSRSMVCNRMIRIASVVALIVAGCGDSEPGAGETGVFRQGLTLAIDGTSHVIPIESMDVWLTSDPSRAEAFEMRGAGVAIVGKLPHDARIDYSGDWHVLVGKNVPLSARGGDPAWEKPAILFVPGVGQFRVLGGSFTVETIGAGPDGKTALSGRLQIEVRAARGATTLKGTFAVMAMTWG